MKQIHDAGKNAARCPICGQPNECAVAADPNATECWCEDVEFPEALLNQVPQHAQRQVCICRNCRDRFMLERKEG